MELLNMHLTRLDVKSLMDEPSPKVRGLLASKIARDYRESNFNAAESQIAADIFRILAKDIEAHVRQALAEQLAYCPNVPKDIILKLANDDAAVAVCILEYSSVLSEDDLLAIVKSTHEIIKLSAIARRDAVPGRLATSLMEVRKEPVAKALFRNPGAALDEKLLTRCWDFISGAPSLLETLVHRGGLSLPIAERIYAAVSEDLRRELVIRYKLNLPMVHKAVNDAREWELLGIMPPSNDADPYDDVQVEDLVDHLFMNGRLTHSLLMRALCMGNLSLFEAGIAKLARVPRVNARILLMDRGMLGLEAIYKTAGMPEGFLEAVKVLLHVTLEETEFGHVRGSDYRKRIIDRIYIEGHHRNVDNMQYLLGIIGGKVGSTANVH